MCCIDVRVSERRRTVGHRGREEALWHPRCACQKKAPPERSFGRIYKNLMHFYSVVFSKCPTEVRGGRGCFWSKHIVIQKMTPVSKKRTRGVPAGVSYRGRDLRPGQRYLKGPGKGGRLRSGHFGRQNETCRQLPGGRARWYFLKFACARLPRRTCWPCIMYVSGS